MCFKLRLAGLLLCLLALLAPVWSEPPSERDLLNKELLDSSDIETLIQLNLTKPDLPRNLRLPRPIEELFRLSRDRVMVAMMLENYDALLRESARRDWLLEFAEVYLDKFGTEEQQVHFMTKFRAQFEVSAALEVFARRQLRVLKPSDLESLLKNRTFTSVDDNVLEIYLLSARAALDQGERAIYAQHLAKVRPALEGEIVTPLRMAYHCLAWHETGDDTALIESARQVVRLGQAYRAGADTDQDIFWISAGNELVDLARALLARRAASPHKSEMETLLRQIGAFAADWHKGLGEQRLTAFAIKREQIWDPEQTRQAQLALMLTSEKLGTLLVSYAPAKRRTAWLGYMKAVLARRRLLLAGSYWTKVPSKLYPVKGDFWSSSALERLDVRADMVLWANRAKKSEIGSLAERMGAISPQDEALELLLDFSQVLLHRDCPEQAVDVLVRAEEVAKRYHFPNYRLEILERILRVQNRLGVPTEPTARRGLRLASESVHQALPLRDGRTAGDLAKVFSAELATQQISQGNARAALEELERGRAIASAQRLSQGASAAPGARGEAIRDLRAAKNSELVESRRKALGEANATQTLARSKTEFLVRSRELQSSFPELYDRVLTIKPVEFPRLQRHLPPKVTLLQYFPTESELFIFAISRQSLVIKRLPLKKAELDRELMAFLRGLRRAKSRKWKARSARLHELLIDPVEKELQSCQTLVVVPSGRLNYLPFAALVDAAGVPLNQRFGLASLGKSSDLLGVLLKNSTRGESLVVLADPGGDLPAAQAEGRALAELFPDSRGLYRQEATLAALGAALSGTTYLHLATHGQIDSNDPAKSFLELAGGEKLRSDDIFALPLEDTQLVTLSACNTALGQAEPTASVLSLAENFWVTGPASVVATLWAVDDTSTSVLMKAFYRGLQKGKGRGEALRLAQQTLRQTAGYEHPYYWSGFVLMGDWR